MQRRDNAERSVTTSIPQHVTPNNAPTLNVLIQMKNDNKSDYTINFTRKALNTISKHADLNKPEEVRTFLAMLKTSNGYKKNLAIAYNKYTRYYKIQWEMPKYKPEAKNIALPTREKIQMLIANSGKLLGMKLQLSMETGLRPVELTRLKVKDLDHKTVNPIQEPYHSAKHSNSN
jgi:integrase